jgi:hypothetical protein
MEGRESEGALIDLAPVRPWLILTEQQTRGLLQPNSNDDDDDDDDGRRRAASGRAVSAA